MCPGKERPAGNTVVFSRGLTRYGDISARQNRVCPCQSMVAIAVNKDGFREVLGAAEGMKEDKASWVSFFQWLRGRGLDGVKLIPFRQSKTGVCPCSHKNWNNGKKNRGCTKYKTIPTDYRLSIDRECLRFKRIYALCTECERYNSRFKASGQERLRVRNGSSAANLNTVAHISALAVALAAVLHGSHPYRSAKQLRRSA